MNHYLTPYWNVERGFADGTILCLMGPPYPNMMSFNEMIAPWVVAGLLAFFLFLRSNSFDWRSDFSISDDDFTVPSEVMT